MSSGANLTTRVAVLTHNRFLYQKIKLELGDMADCIMYAGETIRDASFYLVDADDPAFSDACGLKMSYIDADKDISLPFALGSLKELLFGGGRTMLSIDEKKKCVHLGGRVIQLTDVELSLFSAIYKRGGEYASRDTLLSEVWGGACDSGVINVYVHYLREKLETDGEKVILCSRKCGYAISEKYAGGGKDA